MGTHTDHDTRQEDSQQVDYSKVETYYGISIFKSDKRNCFFAQVFSAEHNMIVEVSANDYIGDLKAEINKYLVQNFYESLTYIADHFDTPKDFNRPESNLENLLIGMKNKINKALE